MKKKAVLFDMDGVLVDVCNSYRLAVKYTAEHFLHQEISLDLIQDYKYRGGLNNDWDLTEQLLLDCGLSIEKEKIIAIFQQFYKGENYNGLIRNEQWVFPRDALAQVARDFKTGIVTGRPRAEALFTLKHFDMLTFFPVVITMEDVPPGQGKPNPLGIRLALEKLNASDGWYLGDTIDDMKAAKGAGLTPVGVVLKSAHHRIEETLRHAGAEEVIYPLAAGGELIKRRNKMPRIAELKRKTGETDIAVSLVLDGSGTYRIETPVGFFNHLLESFARHGSFDLTLTAQGDLHVDQHHLVEDCGIVLGKAIEQVLGDKRGIQRAGFFIFPMDDALALAAVDFSGRPYLQYEMPFSQEYCGSMEIRLLEDFFQALAVHARANIVVRILNGRSDHHKAEAAFKALAKAMRMAVEKDPRNSTAIPSTKGVI